MALSLSLLSSLFFSVSLYLSLSHSLKKYTFSTPLLRDPALRPRGIPKRLLDLRLLAKTPFLCAFIEVFGNGA